MREERREGGRQFFRMRIKLHSRYTRIKRREELVRKSLECAPTYRHVHMC